MSVFGSRRRNSVRLQATQACESRTLLAGVSFVSKGDVFAANGTPDADQITISIQEGFLIIDFNGELIHTKVDAGKLKVVHIRGMAGDDQITLDKSLESISCILSGLDGDDTLIANNSGANLFRGGAGKDFYIGGFGMDKITVDESDAIDSITDQGGNRDTLIASGFREGLTVKGLRDIESIYGTEFNDTLDFSSMESAVRIFGQGGDDTIYSGSGHDYIYSGMGNDVVYGGAGNDFLQGGDGEDLLDGQEGINTVSYGGSPKGVNVDLNEGYAEDGFGTKDQIKNFVNLTGSSFDDKLIGTAESNIIRGNAGHDSISGQDGDDVLWGGAGNDTLVGGRGSDVVMGESGDDVLIGGIDQSTGDGELDWILGGSGYDTSYGLEKITILGVENINK